MKSEFIIVHKKKWQAKIFVVGGGGKLKNVFQNQQFHVVAAVTGHGGIGQPWTAAVW